MKTALVTGAAGGIGSALIDRFDQEGYHTIGLDLQEPEKTVANDWIVQDLTELARFEEAADEILHEVERVTDDTGLNVLVNNAAVQRLAAVEDLSLDDWQETMDVNLTAPFRLSQALLPALEQAGGAIVNVTSIHARQTKPGFVAYATSKAGLEGLTRAMAVELGDRVRINGVAPGAVDTDMLRRGLSPGSDSLSELEQYHPTGEVGEPSDIAELIVEMAKSSRPSLNGSVLDVNGGVGARLHGPE